MRKAKPTGDVDIEFKSDCFPLDKIADGQGPGRAALLDAVDFPVFVAGPIKGVFDAKVEAGIQQMKA